VIAYWDLNQEFIQRISMKSNLPRLICLFLTAQCGCTALWLAPLPAAAQVQALEAWWIDTGETDTTGLGMAVAALGDLNQDGYDDFLVGSGEEKVFVYFGSVQPDTIPHLIIPSPDTTLSLFAKSLYRVGDVNNDGAEDFSVWAVVSQIPDHCQAYIYFGGSLLDTVPDLLLDGQEMAFSAFGQNGADAGDFNGDGGRDFIILDDEYRAIQADTIQGRVYLYFGGAVLDSVPDWQISGGNPFSSVGTDAVALGDINNDGYDDIVLVDPYATGPQGEYGLGYAAIYYGASNPDTLPDIVLWGEEANAFLGESVAAIDFNHDGIKDIVVGSERDYPPSYSTSVYVYLMPPNPPQGPDFIFLDQGYEGGTTGAGLMGIDLNGDGWQDIVSNNYGNALGAGKTYLYMGGIYADTLLDAIFYQGHVMCSLGAGYANVGDINGDGIEDLVIGEPGYNWYVFGSYWGRIYAILGDTIYHQSVAVSPQETTPPIPSALQLNIYPIPSNSKITFFAQFPSPKGAVLHIFTLKGELIQKHYLIGPSSRIIWDGITPSGIPCSSGIYIAKLSDSQSTIFRKFVIIR
jgi:hypothetical protein